MADATMMQMGLYLDNPATQNILLEPISRQLTCATDDVRKLIAQCADGEHGWDVDQRASVNEAVEKIDQVVQRAAKVSR